MMTLIYVNNFNSATDSSKPVKRLNEELKLSTDSI